MSKRLLLADDSITIQKVVNLTFADEGIEVVSVGDGDAAMLKFNESMPDLVLADVNMPGLDGYRMCEMIKQDDETKHIPVILLVGSFEPFDEQEAWRVGADDFLTKPFQSIRQLVTKVSDLLNPPAKAASVAAETGNNDWQFADTKEFPAVEEIADENLGDTGMDDEMIQTDQVGEPVDDVQKFISDSYSYQKPETEEASGQNNSERNLVEESFQTEADGDVAILEPTAETELERITDDEDENDSPVSDVPENRLYDFGEYKPNAEAEENAEVEYAGEIVENAEMTETAETAEVEAAEVETSDEEPQTERISDWQIVSDETQISTAAETPEITEAQSLEEDDQANETAQTEEPAETEFFDEAQTNEDAPESDAPETADETAAPEEFAEESEITDEPAMTEESETSEEIETDKSAEFRVEPQTAVEAETAVEIEAAQETEAGDETETFEEREDAPIAEPVMRTASVAAFDDFDLLELPPLVEETGIRPQPRAEPLVPEVVAPLTAEPESKITVTKTVAESEIALSFPPELIEAIAQKVAEKISDKVIREIALEVVPQMTDLIVKRLAEKQLDENAGELRE